MHRAVQWAALFWFWLLGNQSGFAILKMHGWVFFFFVLIIKLKEVLWQCACFVFLELFSVYFVFQ
jgi:hypothetical protein